MYEKINNFDVDTKVTFVTGVLTNDSTRGGKGETALQPVDNWEEGDWITFRTVLKHELQTKTAEVTFTKLNGETRRELFGKFKLFKQVDKIKSRY